MVTYPVFWETACSFVPKKSMQIAAERGTKMGSQMLGHPVVYPSPLTPRMVMPLQMLETMRRTRTQNPMFLPATSMSSEVLTF
jgi:hypothetical protein